MFHLFSLWVIPVLLCMIFRLLKFDFVYLREENKRKRRRVISEENESLKTSNNQADNENHQQITIEGSDGVNVSPAVSTIFLRQEDDSDTKLNETSMCLELACILLWFIYQLQSTVNSQNVQTKESDPALLRYKEKETLKDNENVLSHCEDDVSQTVDDDYSSASTKVKCFKNENTSALTCRTSNCDFLCSPHFPSLPSSLLTYTEDDSLNCILSSISTVYDDIRFESFPDENVKKYYVSHDKKCVSKIRLSPSTKSQSSGEECQNTVLKEECDITGVGLSNHQLENQEKEVSHSSRFTPIAMQLRINSLANGTAGNESLDEAYKEVTNSTCCHASRESSIFSQTQMKMEVVESAVVPCIKDIGCNEGFREESMNSGKEEERQEDMTGISLTIDAAQALSKEEKIMKSAAVTSIKDMGYTEEIIKTAINTIKSRLPRGKHRVSAQEILEVIFELTDSQGTSETLNNQSEPLRTADQIELSRPALQSGGTIENITNNVSQSDSTTEKTDQSTSEEAVTTGAAYAERPQLGSISVPEVLPIIDESETPSLLCPENNDVRRTGEGQSQGRTSEETISNPSHLSVAPEADGASQTPETPGSFFSSFLSSFEEDKAFRYEWNRLKTFSSWPVTSLFSTVLARDGWMALGEGDRARCYSCHVVHEGWKIGDNPLDFHDNQCIFLQTLSDNVPIVRDDPTPITTSTIVKDHWRMHECGDVVSQGNATQQRPQSEENRNITMNQMSKDIREPVGEEMVNLVALSSSPPDSTPNSEISKSPPAYNSSYTSRPPPKVLRPVESNPITKHSPSNHQGYSAAGAPPLPSDREAQLEALMGDPMGINFDRPKYPSYATLAVRNSSFIDWPTSMTQTPRDMALAGFYYAGCGDYTRCFFCGGGLRNWEAGDDPWVEHARWFSKCAFVRQNRGQQFIDLVFRREAEMEEQRIEQDETGNSQTNKQMNDAAQALSKEEKIMKSAAVISIKDTGYTEEIIKTAINIIKSRLPRGKHKVSAQEILEVIFELEDSEKTSANSTSQSEARRTVNQSESSRPAVHSAANTENVPYNVSQSNSTTEKTDQSANEEAIITVASNAADSGLGEYGIDNENTSTCYDLESLQRENEKLKEITLCKVCKDETVSVVFLPCGHLTCCADCAPAMWKCPICWKFVKSTTNAYLIRSG